MPGDNSGSAPTANVRAIADSFHQSSKPIHREFPRGQKSLMSRDRVCDAAGFHEPSLNRGTLGLQFTRDLRVGSARGAHSLRLLDSAPVITDPAARAAKARVDACAGSGFSRNFERRPHWRHLGKLFKRIDRGRELQQQRADQVLWLERTSQARTIRRRKCIWPRHVPAGNRRSFSESSRILCSGCGARTATCGTHIVTPRNGFGCINSRWARTTYAEGLPVAAAAARVGLSVEQLQDRIDRYPPKLIYE